MVTASLLWGCSSMSPSSSEPVRCSIDVTAAPSLGAQGHCRVPHSGIGPFAAMVAWEHLGCGALGLVQSTWSCSAPPLSAATQPVPHSCSPPKPSSSCMARGSTAHLSCCCQEVWRGEGSCEWPAPHWLHTQPKSKVGALSCRVGVVVKHGYNPSTGFSQPRPGHCRWGSHSIGAWI